MTVEAGARRIARRSSIRSSLRSSLGWWDLLRIPILLALGALLGILGGLLVPAGPRIDGHVVSVGAGIAVFGNPVAVRLALAAVPRLGGVVVMAGWLAVAIVFSGSGRGGGGILEGSGDLAVVSLVFVLGGLASGAFAASIRAGR